MEKAKVKAREEEIDQLGKTNQLDPTIFNAINGSNVDAVRADYFHMLFDISHRNVLCGLD